MHQTPDFFFYTWLTVFSPSSQGKDLLYRIEHDSIFMEISTNRYLLPFCIVCKVFEDVIFECQIFFVLSKCIICNKNQKKYSLFKLKVVEHFINYFAHFVIFWKIMPIFSLNHWAAPWFNPYNSKDRYKKLKICLPQDSSTGNIQT